MTTNMVALPRLREELSLHPGPAAADGSPSWTIRDPVRSRYFRIGWPAFECLIRWDHGTPEAVAEAVAAETTLAPTAEEVSTIAKFLAANQLTRPAGHADTLALARRAEAERQSWSHWLLHHYLFFRIPLVRPDRFLSATLAWVSWLGRPWFARTTILAVIAGLLLVQRQWEIFVATLVDTFSLSGLVAYGLALTFVKVVHELAHAYTAKAYGCRVPTMGLAFLVMWPVLYTDVNETWTLADRRQRLRVGAAGILAELTVAAWATLAWAFLPDGAPRQAAFVLAALTWVSSLAVNLSPFMRFDGYFLLMDGLEMPNLHPRSFAMGRWWLREALFGLGVPPPEALPTGRRNALVGFAFAVWIYRLVLFLGIAVLVYHFFIKAVGVLLFAVEIGWFVLLPLWSEVKEWLKMRQSISAGGRGRWMLAGLGAVLLVASVPWQSAIDAPAVLKAAEVTELYLPFPARLEAMLVGRGDTVTAGQVLAVFAAPDIEHRKAQVAARLEGKRAEMEAAQLDPTYRDRSGILRQDIAKAEAELAAMEAELARLTVVAPADGMFLDPLPGIRAGDWLSPRQKLGLVRAAAGTTAIAYVREDDIARLEHGAEARFIPNSLDFPSLDGRIERIDPSPVKTLPDGVLSAVHGGDIPSRVSGQSIIPEGAITRIRLSIDSPPPVMELTGTARLSGERRSLLGRAFRSVLIVVVREWGA